MLQPLSADFPISDHPLFPLSDAPRILRHCPFHRSLHLSSFAYLRYCRVQLQLDEPLLCHLVTVADDLQHVVPDLGVTFFVFQEVRDLSSFRQSHNDLVLVSFESTIQPSFTYLMFTRPHEYSPPQVHSVQCHISIVFQRDLLHEMVSECTVDDSCHQVEVSVFHT